MRKYILSFVLSRPVALRRLARGDAATPPFAVTSSLDGKTVLPLRTRWLAYPKLPAAKIQEVDFLIDGKLRWIEHQRAVQLR